MKRFASNKINYKAQNARTPTKTDGNKEQKWWVQKQEERKYLKLEILEKNQKKRPVETLTLQYQKVFSVPLYINSN